MLPERVCLEGRRKSQSAHYVYPDIVFLVLATWTSTKLRFKHWFNWKSESMRLPKVCENMGADEKSIFSKFKRMQVREVSRTVRA